ncbi:1155_t:CDS:10 [Entrophospora sp. SA101]|nr:1155_t:CDS:10 [Entrophospora sp. SA101]
MFDSFLNYQKDPKGCNLSYMHPYYIKQNGFDSEQTRFAGKYSLYLYRDQPYDTSNQPLGIPALFIPGNAGSYKQVRSIAAETSKLYYEVISKQSRSFVDFNEEYSALHGHSLCEQAEYLNDAIRYILSLYPSIRKSQQTSSSSQPYPDPTAVILIGHSMGGVVARTLFQTPNFQPGSINTILTMSTPHTLPPASFDWKINTESSSNSLMDVTLISIAGGNLDTIVCSDSTNINSLVPDSNGFTVFTTSIPKVWTSMDHQCILWCEQLVKVVANTLLNIVDIRRSTQTIPTSQRMKVFRKNLLTGLEDSIDIDKSPREFFDILDLGKGSYQFLDMGQRLVLNNTSSKSQIYLMPIPPSAPHSTLNTFTFLTDQSLSKYSGIKLLLCDVMPTEVPERVTDTDFYSNDLLLPIAPKLSCFYISSDDIVLLPESTFESKNTFSDKTFNFVKLKVKELGDYQYIVVMFDELNLMNKGFFIGEFYDENSSLLTYKISIQRSGCDGQQHFAPFLRQSISSMYESKFFVNVNNIELNIHGRSPFGAGFNNNNNGSNSNNSFIMNQKGLELQFWIDPTCPSPLSIDIEFDFYGSLGKIVMRFQTVLAAFPFIIVIITFYHQLKEYNHSDLLPIDSYINERLLSSSLFEIDDILLGNQNLCFWFLPALFLILSTGITTLCWILLSLFIKYVAGIIIFINNLGLLNLDRQLFSRPTESNTSQLRRRVITATILFILVATFVPYQFAFLVAFFVHLMSCIRSLVMAHLQIYNYYHYLHSILMILFMLLPFNIPILMVWIRNISVSWFEPFSWDNNVLAIAPIVFYVEIITNVNNMLPRIVESDLHFFYIDINMSQAVGNTALAYARIWHLVDARQRILGRMASSIAVTLMGKHKPIYDPASDCGDYVVVINAKHVTVTGKKSDQKIYRHHTGYPGGLKEIPYKDLLRKTPEEIIRKAVSGMLPKNRLRDIRLSRLKVFPESKHSYEKNIIKRYDQETMLLDGNNDHFSKIYRKELRNKERRIRRLETKEKANTIKNTNTTNSSYQNKIK